MKPIKIGILPDVQTKEGVPTNHLAWAGRYFAEKQPDVIVCLGDFADMPSLSEYDKGKKSYEGRRYVKDVDAARKGMDLFISPITKAKKYKPQLVFTLGNHEQRIIRACETDAKLEGTIGIKNLRYEDAGWKVHPFLKPVKVAGFHFSHYFPSGVMGKPCISARKMLTKFHVSCIAGHQQGLDTAIDYKPDGKRIFCMIAGSFYQHDEHYIPYVTNRHWRGLVMLHEATDGQADPMFVSLNYLKKRFKR